MNEDLKPIVSEELNAEQEQSATVSETVVENSSAEIEKAPEVVEEGEVEKEADEVAAPQDENSNETETEACPFGADISELGLKELVDLFTGLIEKGDVQLLYKHAEEIKAAFYKTLKKEKIAAGYIAPKEQVEEAASAEDGQGEGENAEQPVSQNPFAEVERWFKDLYAKYKTLRADYLQELNSRKDDNFKIKSEVIEELKELVDNQVDLNKAYPKFRELQAKWRSAGAVPPQKAKDLYETYSHYVERFYDFVKINREIRDLDFKKNLEAKQALCEKAEALAEEENVVSAFHTLQTYHELWKEYGPVDKENRESIWERFKAATAVINKKHQEYFDAQKGNQKQNLEAKQALCERVEAIAETVVEDSNTWNTLSKEIESIQKEWRTIGFASKKENQKIYDRFRAACDKFYSTKREFYSDFKGQMQENMEKKIALCEAAEAVSESDDWKKTSDLLIDLQKQWKEIGPVSRKKSEQIWKRFRAACDKFFDRRDKHFGSQEGSFSDNLNKKNALIAEIKAYEMADEQANIQALKDFQAQWAAIGFVPFKEKEKIQAEYTAALQEKFGDLVQSERAPRAKRHDNRGGRQNSKPMSEKDRLIAKFIKMEQEITTWENNMGFFSKSKNAEALLSELSAKIDAARAELAELEEKIKAQEQQEQGEE